MWSSLVSWTLIFILARLPLAQAGLDVATSHGLISRRDSSPILHVLQVYPPVLTVAANGSLEISDGSSSLSVSSPKSQQPTCQDTLVVHSFGFSYGKPYVGVYNPPRCSFNRVSWNLTVTSAGRQFDRLGSVFLGNVEVFRTSTAEPTAKGIIWTYIKDMTNFLSLFKSQQKLIFDLGNLIDNTYTGAFNVTLTASYFTAPDHLTPADLIVPVSSGQADRNLPSMFTVPSQQASQALTLPRNIKKAVFTIAATGQQAEEFWWSNALQSTIDTFPDSGKLYGYSPFREVQLYIDDTLAGVAWPFPIIFTGGVVPGLWRPVVGIDTFDLREDEIDITPFLPRLCDGKPHNFTIRVSGLNDDGHGRATLSETTGAYWLVTGKVFVWLDEDGHVTTGDGPRAASAAPVFQTSSTLSKGTNGTNSTLLYEVHASRELSFRSTLKLASGSQTSTWAQSLSFSNFGNFTNGGNVETNRQQTTGLDRSSSGYVRRYSYPLYAYSSLSTGAGSLSIQATVNRGKSVQTLGEAVFPTGLESFSVAGGAQARFTQFQGSSLVTEQDGTATYLANTTAGTSSSFGQTRQDMTFSGVRIGTQPQSSNFPAIVGGDELFRRHVLAVNGSVVEDDETLIGHAVGQSHESSMDVGNAKGFAAANVPGRGSSWFGQQTFDSRGKHRAERSEERLRS